MPLEKKVQIMEGLKVAIGPKRAIYCWARFHHLYPAKHGTCLEYIQRHEGVSSSFIDYTRREQRVWARYAMMYMHTIERLRYAAREKGEVVTFPGVK